MSGGRRSLIGLIAGAALLAASAPGCGGAGVPQPSAGEVRGEVRVFAASSLTDAFEEMAVQFRAEHPQASVAFNFASSSALAVQINEGAPADVFASADFAQLRVVAARGGASEPVVFATNDLVVVVPARGARLHAFEELARPGLRLVLAARDVPIGAYSREILVKASMAAGGPGPDFTARVLANLRSEEANVRAVLAKVQLGEADAGIVYRTDAATAAREVAAIAIPRAWSVMALYPIAALNGGRNRVGAQAWVDFVLSPAGQETLARFQFGKPPQ